MRDNEVGNQARERGSEGERWWERNGEVVLVYGKTA